MSEPEFDLAKMTVNDLFQAKNDRRRRLADLPFERKIEIVEKFNAIVRETLREKEQRKSESNPDSARSR